MYHPDLIRHPDSCPALVLNADYTPLSYYPLSLWPWQTAVKAVFLERVDIVAHYEREVHSPSRRAEAAVGDRAARNMCGRPNIPPSPGSTCSCATASAANIAASRKELTFDHVVPRAQGGRTTWENVATACAPCNLRKGGRTPREAHMHIQREPIRPTSWQLQEHGRASRPTICTRAGATVSTGTSSWSRKRHSALTILV